MRFRNGAGANKARGTPTSIALCDKGRGFAQACHEISTVFWHDMMPQLEVDMMEGSRFVKELKQDADVSLDVQFGSISFVQNDNAPFASISVIVTFPDGHHREGRDSVRLDIGFPADPAIDTIMSVVEKSRLAVIGRLAEAAKCLEATMPSELLFGEVRGRS